METSDLPQRTPHSQHHCYHLQSVQNCKKKQEDSAPCLPISSLASPLITETQLFEDGNVPSSVLPFPASLVEAMWPSSGQWCTSKNLWGRKKISGETCFPEKKKKKKQRLVTRFPLLLSWIQGWCLKLWQRDYSHGANASALRVVKRDRSVDGTLGSWTKAGDCLPLFLLCKKNNYQVA